MDTTTVGSSSQKVFAISNTGLADLSVTGITVSGTDASLFSVSPTTAILPPRTSQRIFVTFAPSSVGSRSATLSIAHNAGGTPLTVSLAGTGNTSPPPPATSSPGPMVTNLAPGAIATLAGGNPAESGPGDGGPAARAVLYSSQNVFVDRSGNLYIADQGNAIFLNQSGRVRKVDPSGIITTVAGSGRVGGPPGDGGPAISATLSGPKDVFKDDSGNLFISDGNLIRKVDGRTGLITTVAGGAGGLFGLGDGGPAKEGWFLSAGICVDRSGNLYIADEMNHRVRMVDPSGIITTVAGNGKTGFSGDGGPAVNASLNQPLESGWTVRATSTSPIFATTGCGRWTSWVSSPPWREAGHGAGGTAPKW